VSLKALSLNDHNLPACRLDDRYSFALKLMIRGVHVDGVAGEHSGYFSYLEVRKKKP